MYIVILLSYHCNTLRVHVYVYMYIWVCMFVCMQMHMSLGVCACVCVWICVCECSCGGQRSALSQVLSPLVLRQSLSLTWTMHVSSFNSEQPVKYPRLHLFVLYNKVLLESSESYVKIAHNCAWHSSNKHQPVGGRTALSREDCEPTAGAPRKGGQGGLAVSASSGRLDLMDACCHRN